MAKKHTFTYKLKGVLQKYFVTLRYLCIIYVRKINQHSHNRYFYCLQDRARFSDTSWQIHRAWARNGDPLPLSPAPARSLLATIPSESVTTTAPQRSNQNGIYDTITVTVRYKKMRNNPFLLIVHITTYKSLRSQPSQPRYFKTCFN